MRRNHLLPELTLTLALAFSLGPTFAQIPVDQATPNYTYTPKTNRAGEGFNLSLTPLNISCAATFDHLSVEAQGDTALFFTFVTTVPTTDVICISSIVAPSLSFKVPALKAGKYALYAINIPPCAYATEPGQPVCKIALIPDYFGTLTITQTKPTIDDAWHVKPVAVAANSPFDLAVVHSQYGSCQTEFTHTQLSIDSVTQKISTSFVITEHPDHVCIQNVSPYGPTFNAPALPAGNYQVEVKVIPACAYPATPTAPICLMEPIQMQTAEMLSVLDTSLTFGKGWFIENPSVSPLSSFSLKLRNFDYPPCENQFPHGNYQLDGNHLRLKFATKATTGQVCTDVVAAGGPDFPVQNLPAGDYPILIGIYPDCAFSSAPCPTAELPEEWVATLHVQAGTAIRIQPMNRYQGLGQNRLKTTVNLLGRAIEANSMTPKMRSIPIPERP